MSRKKNKIRNAIDAIIFLIITILVIMIPVVEILNIPNVGIYNFEHSAIKLILGVFLLYYLVGDLKLKEEINVNLTDEVKKHKKHIDRIEFMMYLYADIVENKEKVSDDLFQDLVTKFKMSTSYNSERTIENIETTITFMKNEIWVDLYGKAYDDFTKDN